jgi:molybdate transport system substrate-binding protein
LGFLRRPILLLLASLLPSTAAAQRIAVAAASDLQFVLPEITARFQKATGYTVGLTFGSSGNFFSQIQNGAPFDLFFSADLAYPKKLEAAGLAEPGTLYRYAAGRIVLWVPKESPIDINRGLIALTDPGIHRIAIANPRHAPYGRAAAAALRHEGIYERVGGKLVLGENISQTAQFVESANADIGILALSLAQAPALKTRGRYFEIPASFYPPIEQGVILLKSSHEKKAARQFLDFLRKPEIVKLMRGYGFSVADR